MTVLFLEARYGQCRTPRWTDATPLHDRLVCGGPTLPTKSYCAECRPLLIAGIMNRDGSPNWFSSSTEARWGKPASTSRTLKVAEPDDGTASDDPEENFESTGVEEASSTVFDDESEPEGDRPLEPTELQDWGTAVN